MALPVYSAPDWDKRARQSLEINPELVADWLVKFLRYEVITRRKMSKVVLGLSGGVDSAVVAYLAVRAFGADNVTVIRMPYKISSSESLIHAQLVIDDLGLPFETKPITDMVDGYANLEPGISPQRIGNLCARCRTAILFDWSLKIGGLPLGTGNKTERMFGYFTWHADDAPPINPLGDLFKVQVWQLARHLGVPDVIVNKPASADLIQGQTDEKDYGITYERADPILFHLVSGYTKQQLIDLGFDSAEVEIVWKRVAGTHWKRKLPTVAVLTNQAIGEYYLRPVDY